ncbi:DNA adenine methylase [Terasakiella sp.]|uniref:DNA adenine methylase n=1 Tax=Terasakiella sp. TaxID=2034861 RepID=UPI003AA814A8
MESLFEDIVKPIEPIAPWLGGKKRLAKRIVTKINSIPHKVYCEPFVGMGGVFLRRTVRPPAEVINDFSGEVINLFRVLQRFEDVFIRHLKHVVPSRSEFNRMKSIDPATLLDIERAVRFFYLQRLSFGGKAVGQSFGVSVDRGGRLNVKRIEDALLALHERLAGVQIENLSYEDFIPLYDTPDTLFYLDPPYYDCETDYGKNMFRKADFLKLSGLLRQIEGKFIMSLNDVPQVHDIYKGFTIEAVETTYSIARVKEGRGAFGEVLICNF